ncbi:MAG: hypothetical protein ACFFE8_16325, partial [Candidatus Heimdallarchaeota archaeon]
MTLPTVKQPMRQIRLSRSFWRQLAVMSKKELTIRFRYPIAVLSDILEMILIVFFFAFSVKAFTPANEGNTSEIVSG